MADYQYCIAENWGKGFIENSESSVFTISGYPANIWQVPINNKRANLWIAKVLGTVKTRDEAQAILNTEMDARQTAWEKTSYRESSHGKKNRHCFPVPFQVPPLGAERDRGQRALLQCSRVHR